MSKITTNVKGPLDTDGFEFYFNEVVCDYIRLTTYDAPSYEFIVRECFPFTSFLGREEECGVHVMQYTGERRGAYFAGVGKQRGKDHFFIQVSGGESHQLLQKLIMLNRPLDVRCTRFDLQATFVRKDDWKDLISCAIDLKDDEIKFNRTGPKPKITAYMGEDTLNTINIGTRKRSNSYFRFYDKRFPGMNQTFRRFEIEFKREKGAKLFNLALGGANLKSLWREEMLKMPDEFFEWNDGLLDFVSSGEAVQEVRVKKKATDLMSRINWLRDGVYEPWLEIADDPLLMWAGYGLLYNLFSEYCLRMGIIPPPSLQLAEQIWDADYKPLFSRISEDMSDEIEDSINANYIATVTMGTLSRVLHENVYDVTIEGEDGTPSVVLNKESSLKQIQRIRDRNLVHWSNLVEELKKGETKKVMELPKSHPMRILCQMKLGI